MKRTNRLTPLRVRRLREPGMYPDGGGLYLQVTLGKSGAINKSWVYRYTALSCRERYMGLGVLSTTSLARARELAAEAFEVRRQFRDPIEERKARKAAAARDTAKLMTFDECAAAYITSHRAGWHSARYVKQWTSTLAAYVSPILGRLSVGAIDTGLVFKVIDPLWRAKPETATQLRGRIESILDWAKVRGYRAGENPARWRGHLDKLLPKRSQVCAVEHFAALPYTEIGELMTALRQREDVPAAALQFLVLTAARPTEARCAKWDEIDLKAGIWTVPAARMKGKKEQRREHRVPLSAAAIAVLRRMAEVRETDHVFPSARGVASSDRVFKRLLERMGRADVTAHGFRSTFRNWAAEQTSFPREVAEAALAHLVGNETERAYQRGDLFEKRRRLMDKWAAYCAKPARPERKEENVLQFRA